MAWLSQHIGTLCVLAIVVSVIIAGSIPHRGDFS